jgi:hypothetical protein
MEVLNRIKNNTVEKRLLNSSGLPNFGINFYILNAKGEFAGVTMYEGSSFAICNENGPQTLKAEALLQGKASDFKEAAAKFLLSVAIIVRLHHPENISFGVFAVELTNRLPGSPSSAPRPASVCQCSLHRLVDIGYIDCANVSNHSLSVDLTLSPHETTIDTRLIVWTSV